MVRALSLTSYQVSSSHETNVLWPSTISRDAQVMETVYRPGRHSTHKAFPPRDEHARRLPEVQSVTHARIEGHVATLQRTAFWHWQSALSN